MLPDPKTPIYEEPELIFNSEENTWYFERWVYVPDTSPDRLHRSQPFTNSRTADKMKQDGKLLWHEES